MLFRSIWDEDDEIPHSFAEINENTFEVFGEHDLRDMFERLEIDDDSIKSDYSTVGGWALHILEHIPKIGEEFVFLNFLFTVLEMDGHRLKKLKIAKVEKDLK